EPPRGAAVFWSAAAQYFTFFQSGCDCFTSAAIPAVCGAAIEVPDRIAASVPVPMPADAMLTPGAVTFGLRELSPVAGPNEVKLARALYPGLAMSWPTIVIGVPLAAMNFWPFADVDGFAPPATPRNGIVTLNGTPSSGLLVILPSNGGRLAELLTMITPAAPACWPKIAFATRAHVPRATTMNVLAGIGPLARSSATEQPRLITP